MKSTVGLWERHINFAHGSISVMGYVYPEIANTIEVE